MSVNIKRIAEIQEKLSTRPRQWRDPLRKEWLDWQGS